MICSIWIQIQLTDAQRDWVEWMSFVTCSTWSRFLHLVPLYLTSFPHFSSVSCRNFTSFSDSIQTSLLGRSIWKSFTPERQENKSRPWLQPWNTMITAVKLNKQRLLGSSCTKKVSETSLKLCSIIMYWA